MPDPADEKLTDKQAGNGQIPASDRMASYIAKRVDPQLSYFETASAKAKRSHQGYVAAQLLATSSIPVANAVTGSVVISTVLAGLAAVATGLAALYSHQESWLRYRRSAAALESLKSRFEHGLAPFDGEDREALFIEDVEQILGSETDQWGRQVSSANPLKDAKRAQAKISKSLPE